MKKTQIIYWAHLAPQYREGHINLLNSSPKNLMVDLAKDRFNFNNGYTNCVALHEQLKNTFYVEFPFDMDIQVPKPNVFEGEKSWVISRERPDNFKNRSTVDIDLGWYFFSPESVNLEVFPPYAHKTETNKFAVMTYGSFNISQWFRPIRATHILWEGVKEFKAKEGEPIMYLRFDTDKPIIFKKFIATPTLASYASACVDYSLMKGWKIPLKKRYAQFQASGMRNLILDEIEKNIIEER